MAARGTSDYQLPQLITLPNQLARGDVDELAAFRDRAPRACPTPTPPPSTSPRCSSPSAPPPTPPQPRARTTRTPAARSGRDRSVVSRPSVGDDRGGVRVYGERVGGGTAWRRRWQRAGRFRPTTRTRCSSWQALPRLPAAAWASCSPGVGRCRRREGAERRGAVEPPIAAPAPQVPAVRSRRRRWVRRPRKRRSRHRRGGAADQTGEISRLGEKLVVGSVPVSITQAGRLRYDLKLWMRGLHEGAAYLLH